MAGKQGSADEILMKLSLNIEKVRELGISYGLPDRDIDYCIFKTFSANEHRKFELESASFLRKVRRVAKKVCFLLILCSCVFTAAVSHPPTVRFAVFYLQPYAYPVSRTLRLATLPITRRMDLSAYYDSECIINNPWYYEAAMAPCEMCHDITEVDTVMPTDKSYNFTEQFQSSARPIFVRNALIKEVTVEDLVQLYKGNKGAFGQAQSTFKSSDKTLKSLPNLFEKYPGKSLKNKKSLHVSWTSRSLLSSQLIRKFFPRPQVIPAESEVAVEKSIFIDGLHSQPYNFPIAHFANAWYVQSSGQRVLHLYPAIHCLQECSQFRVIMEPKSILFYNNHFWNIDSVATDHVYSPSLGFMGSFMV